MKFVVYTDGGSRGNPGLSASGFAVYDHNHKLIHANSHFNGKQTNNFAEYTAVIKALHWCANNIPNPADATIELYSDSELVVRQINGKYKVKAKHIVPLNQEVKELRSGFKMLTFHNLPREEEHIAKVDAALNRLLDTIEAEHRAKG